MFDFDNTKSVLLTGSSGYIGGELFRYLQGKGIICLGIDKNSSESTERKLRLNLNDTEDVEGIINKLKPDIIIHAGTNSMPHYKRDFIGAFHEDWLSMRNILNSVRELQDTRILFFSSSYVYSKHPSQESVREDICVNPANNFGAGKLFFEHILANTHPNSIIYRLSSVFGPGTPMCPNTIETMIKESIQSNKVVIWGNGERKMQYVYMDDVIRFVLHSDKIDTGIYNLGSNDYLPIRDVALSIAELVGADVVYLREKKEGEMLPFMDNSKIKGVIKQEFRDVVEVLHDYIKTFFDACP